MKVLILYRILLWVLLIPCFAFGQIISVRLLPDTAIYQKYYADAISHQLSVSKHLESSQWFGNIGGTLPLADVEFNHHNHQLSLGATVFNTLFKTPGHIQVYTVDYLVELFGDTKIIDNFVGRFIWGHLSAHYSDDGIVELGNTPINYVRDYIGLHFEYFFTPTNGKFYAGSNYLYHNEPDSEKLWTIQFGGDGGMPIYNDFSLYGAVDFKYKAEVNFGSTQSFQLGVKYLAHNKKTAFRVAYTHRRGFEERGQIYNQSDNKNTFGLFIDF